MGSNSEPNYYVGLMCGTSVDGIDAVLVEFTARGGFKLIKTHCADIEDSFIERMKKFSLAQYDEDEDPVETLGGLHRDIGHAFAAATNQLLAKEPFVPKEKIRAIGSHGVTVRHRPHLGYTMQIGDPNIIAAETGLDVVADFRSMNVALGGQGAPIVPVYHKTLFDASSNENCCVLNIGGIANVSVMSGDKLYGFDTGPGNTLIDGWCNKNLGHSYDRYGSWARSGKLNKKLLEHFMDGEEYFKKPFPKSTGKELFNMTWLQKRLDSFASPLPSAVDVQCTLTHLTAESIAQALGQFDIDEIYVCGGGAHNVYLVELLESNTSARVRKTDALGLDADWVEATAFAWFAKCRMEETKLEDLPEVSGSRRAEVLGGLYKGK